MKNSKIKKIVFINTLYYPYEKGGAERSVRAVAEEHVRKGGASIVVTLSPERKIKISNHNGVKVYYLPVCNVSNFPFSEHGNIFKKVLWKIIDLYNPFIAAKVYKILKSEQPDIFKTNNLQGFSVAVWTAAKYLKIPVVHVVRDYYLSCNNSCMFKNDVVCKTQCRSCKIACAGKKDSSRYVGGLCGVSQRVLDIYKNLEYFPNVKSKKAVYSSVFTTGDKFPTQTIKKENDSCMRVGFIGRHENIKGIETLLKAAKHLDKDNYKFLIAGDGDVNFSAHLKETYGQDNIHFLGWVSPEEFYSKIDILVVPSLWEEPFGRIIAESYKFGLPVIVSDKGGMPEVVESGITGMIFKSGDYQSLANRIESAKANSNLANKSYLQNHSNTFSSHAVYLRHKQVWDVVMNPFLK